MTQQDDLFLLQRNMTTYYETLKQQGVETEKDLKYLTEEDLEKLGT